MLASKMHFEAAASEDSTEEATMVSLSAAISDEEYLTQTSAAASFGPGL
jgi:hypothetical protein